VGGVEDAVEQHPLFRLGQAQELAVAMGAGHDCDGGLGEEFCV
jgi:hypothetical protein